MNTANNYAYICIFSVAKQAFVATSDSFPAVVGISPDPGEAMINAMSAVQMKLNDLQQSHQDVPKATVPTDEVWPPFWFESNQFFQTIDGPDVWERLRRAYPDMSDEQLLNAKEATYNGTRDMEERIKRPNYGFRIEHDGEQTLRDFFKKNLIPFPNKLSVNMVNRSE